MNLKLLAPAGPVKGAEVSKEKIAFRDGPLTDASGDLERPGFNGEDSAICEGAEHGLIISQRGAEVIEWQASAGRGMNPTPHSNTRPEEGQAHA